MKEFYEQQPWFRERRYKRDIEKAQTTMENQAVENQRLAAELKESVESNAGLRQVLSPRGQPLIVCLSRR